MGAVPLASGMESAGGHRGEGQCFLCFFDFRPCAGFYSCYNLPVFALKGVLCPGRKVRYWGGPGVEVNLASLLSCLTSIEVMAVLYAWFAGEGE